MPVRYEQAIARLSEFIEELDIDCADDVYQRDSVNDDDITVV